MNCETATTAKTLPASERKAHVAALVASGRLSPKQAALIDYRAPSARERAFAEKLVPRAHEALARSAMKAA